MYRLNKSEIPGFFFAFCFQESVLDCIYELLLRAVKRPYLFCSHFTICMVSIRSVTCNFKGQYKKVTSAKHRYKQLDTIK